MEISINNRCGFELVFEADNVKVVEDIEQRTYEKLENGKIDTRTPPKRDIKTDVLEQFVSLLDDMIYYRKEEYDSTYLIDRLFDKMPHEKAKEILNILCDRYEIETIP